MRGWTDLKGAIADALGIPQDLLHVPAGLALFLLAALCFRRQHSGLSIVLGVVLGVQLLNEVSDAFQWYRWTATVDWSETLRDTGMTMIAPIGLAIGWAARRALRGRREASKAAR